jgi:hypothetical protein
VIARGGPKGAQNAGIGAVTYSDQRKLYGGAARVRLLVRVRGLGLGGQGKGARVRELGLGLGLGG